MRMRFKKQLWPKKIITLRVDFKGLKVNIQTKTVKNMKLTLFYIAFQVGILRSEQKV